MGLIKGARLLPPLKPLKRQPQSERRESKERISVFSFHEIHEKRRAWRNRLEYTSCDKEYPIQGV